MGNKLFCEFTVFSNTNGLAGRNDDSQNFSTGSISNTATFGAGCYWGTERYMKSQFPGWRSVEEGHVGFMGPPDAVASPSYEQVCKGDTGHVEVFHLKFSGGANTYEELVRYFFQFHDPTTQDRQINDVGTQYASVIYYHDETQKQIATMVRDQLQEYINDGTITCFTDKTVTTAIKPATVFYIAKEEHQEYLLKNPKGYCNHRVRFKAWPDRRVQEK